MENKKLFKFLYKDIAEIEELFNEKGSEGFDKYEIEFIQSRFKGAKQIVQILSEKENKQVTKIRPRPAEEDTLSITPSKFEEKENEQAALSDVEKESLNTLAEFEEELKESEQPEQKVITDKEVQSEAIVEKEIKEEPEEQPQTQPETENKDSKIKEASQPVKNNEEDELKSEAEISDNQNSEPDVELKEETDVDEANHRLGDSFSKEKSVNELLANSSNKLEDKISNSPVSSIKSAIGINDRYLYIRELFNGEAETFSTAVDELDNLSSINEAVSYLQQNYKWKKNDTSLKFVSLVKRRFSNE